MEVRKVKLDKSKRIIITSDIHANLSLLKKLLTKVKFTKEDYLFINGDLCEKGPNSFEVIDFVKKLMNENKNVYVTKGNCDVVHRYVLDGNEGILAYIRNRKYSVLNEMMALHNKSIDDFDNLAELATFYQEEFPDVISWLESLPEAYEIDDHIIVHAGIDNIDEWQETDVDTALYIKAFQEKEHQSEKTVIVGHWPVVNYRSQQVSSHNPMIDLDKKIISIDGGNQIKKDGQLNALIIENEQFSYTFVDALDNTAIIQKEYIPSTNRVGTVTYPNYEMKIIKPGIYFTECENINLGTRQWIKNEYLKEKEGRTFCKDDLSATFLTVNLGECVKIADDHCDGYLLIKKDSGEVGWIPRECVAI